ncbi:MAG: [protein-PII] uridylyltransferase [Desulfobacterales bacterium]|nr:[protein-PII] uridylyltransferase [Desulfobacterales bacterium]
MKNIRVDILVEKKKKLINAFLNRSESNLLHDLSSALDEYFYETFENSITARNINVQGNAFALVALGGYGREEQCIHSDIDILILFENKIPSNAEAFIQDLVYPLWDARFEVGYSVRTIDESLAIAFERFDVLTTMLDARFICGASHIYSSLMERFREKLNKKNNFRTCLKNLINHSEKMHSGFGDSTYLLEPNLKSGHGGLRDYHTLLWYGKTKSDIKSIKDLEYYGLLTYGEHLRLIETLSFIWRVRNFLHYISKRKCDQLHFEYQIELAKLLGFKSSKGQRPVEAFMGELHSKMEFMKHIAKIVKEGITISISAKDPKTFPDSYSPMEGLTIKQNRINFTGTVPVINDPSLLLKIFLESGKRKTTLSIEAKRIVNEFRYLVDKDFRQDKENIKIFKKILSLSLWKFNILNVMLATGLLVKFIPEFASLINKIQFNQYHLFPVDKHSIRCVQIVNNFRGGKDSPANTLYSIVHKEIRNKNTLLIAALLHDVGKGAPPGQGHSEKGAKIVQKPLKRMRYTSSEISDITFIIKNHLFLIKIATRRDINDEETAVFCAKRIETLERLRMLYLLSVADSMATGPKAWNDWTETLLKDLFLKIVNVMKNKAFISKKNLRDAEKKKAKLLRWCEGKLSTKDIQKKINSMSYRYLLHMPTNEIIEHIGLILNLGDDNFSWQIKTENESGLRIVSICGKDKPGFFSKVAGVFFLNNLSIQASDAFSWDANTVLDIFRVMPPKDIIFEQEKWTKVKKDLSLAFDDDNFLKNLDNKIPQAYTPAPGQLLQPSYVKFDNITSSFYTIIEVYTHDFPGILFAITNALYENNIDVKLAKIATKIDQVIDIFYVCSAEHGQKIESSETLATIKNSILHSLPETNLKEEQYEKN